MIHPNESRLTPEMDVEVRRELEPGEQVIWSGRRVGLGPWKIFQVLTMLFGVFFCLFAIAWMVIAFWITRQQGGPASVFAFLFPLAGIPFFLVGIGVALYPRRLTKKMLESFYALTDRRAICWHKGSVLGADAIRSYSLDAMPELSRVERSDGTGDLVFRRVHHARYDATGSHRSVAVVEGFLGIADVAEVERKLREIITAR